MQGRTNAYLAAAFAVASLALGACQGQRLLPETPAGGALYGAAAGATAAQLLGDDTGTLETLLATVAGGLIGQRLLEKQNVEQALAQNETITLQPQGNQQVTIRPVNTFQREGRLCREFIVSTAAPAQAGVQSRRAVACQVGAGQWRLVQA